MTVKIIKRLSQFMDWVEELNDGEYLFRGVKNVSYIEENKEVKTSSERRLSVDSLTPDRLLEVNKELMEKVRSIGHGHKDGRELSDLNLLAELQHFGAATCLIDFTYSALIALWFACQKETGKEQKNGKVVALRTDWLNPVKKVNYDMSGENIDYFFQTDDTGRYPRYQWRPQHQNNRIIAQQSVFVFGHPRIKIDAECEIEMDKKTDILEALEELSGITGEGLFADFYGCAWLNAHDKPNIEPTAKAYRKQGMDARQKGDTEKAINCLTEAININGGMDLDSRNAENYKERGQVYYAAKSYDQAIENYNRAIELFQGTLNSETSKIECAYVYNLIGIAFVAKGEAIIKESETLVVAEDKASEVNEFFEQAISAYNTAIREDEELTRVYNNLGNAHASMGILARRRGDSQTVETSFEQAIANYNILIETEDELAAVAYCNRGEVRLHQFNWEEAREDLKTAKQMGMNITNSFQNDYKSVEEFKRINEEELPEDITEMLEIT